MDSQNATATEDLPQEERQASAAETHKRLRTTRTAQDLGIRRQEKIHEHLAGTLESTDTLQACMGPIACDLLEMLYELKQGITEAFATGPMASERMDNLRPTIELYARLANQAYKLAHLEHRLKESAKGPQR